MAKTVVTAGTVLLLGIGFLAPDEKVSYGRPVGVTLGHDKRSLLMADDVGNVIWRVTGA